MAYAAKVLADSVSPDGVRLTTLQVTFPRFVLAEFNTHRMFSRNSASSRAIPVEKRIAMIEEDPFIPEQFGKNQKGMQAHSLLEERDAAIAKDIWFVAVESAISKARGLARLGVHKQLANRLLEPFAWHTCIVTATEWSNFFALRCNPDAQPEIRKAAELMRDAMAASEPRRLEYDDWHLPLVDDENGMMPEIKTFIDENAALTESETWSLLCKISVARCARVSYLTHDGRRDPQADLELYERLVKSGHMSPLEHVARPITFDDMNADRVMSYGANDGYDAAYGPQDMWMGNLRGWFSFRKTIPNEDDFSKMEQRCPECDAEQGPGVPPVPLDLHTCEQRRKAAR